MDQGKICLEFGNGYFSNDSDGSDQSETSLSTAVDPLGILVGEVSEARHTEDNVVLYFCAVPVAKGKYHFVCNLRRLCILS